MASHNNTGRFKKQKLGRFIALPHPVIDSPGYRAASPAARAVFIEALRLYDGKNNGSLALSVRLIADQANISKDTASRAIAELINCGLLRRTKSSSFSQKKLAAEYRITFLICNLTLSAPSKEYLTYGQTVSPAIDISAHMRSAHA